MDRSFHSSAPPRRAPPPPRSSGPPKSLVPAKRSSEAQEAAWAAEEDRFMLQQAKKRSALRIQRERAKPIDWIVAIHALVEPKFGVTAEDDDDDDQAEIVDPEGIIEALDESQAKELLKDIDPWTSVDTSRSSREFWKLMQDLCKDRIQKIGPADPSARAVRNVSSDIDRLLSQKSFQQLQALEQQIRQKLNSREPIDTDYWEHLLRSLPAWKARVRMRDIYKSAVAAKLQKLRKQQDKEATVAKESVQLLLEETAMQGGEAAAPRKVMLDPEPFLKRRVKDKALETVDEESFLQKIVEERRRVLKLGYVPPKRKNITSNSALLLSRTSGTSDQPSTHFASAEDDNSADAVALLARELARGTSDLEEAFEGEQEVGTRPEWADKYRPRKPRYFNRVIMGYDWNKYNQTHYDHDNPPQKMVQGYKFNIFYPDLINQSDSPRYWIERPDGRTRPRLAYHAPGEEDTCVIRFSAGPPYQDIAFKVVDKEWDWGPRKEIAGRFKCRFEKGILQLHFTFKKIYYRK